MSVTNASEERMDRKPLSVRLSSLLSARSRKLLAVLGVSLLALIMMSAPVPIYTTFDRIDLDFSWEMDLAYKLQQGEISGRDFFFTYGVGSQLIYNASILLRPNASVIDRAPLTYIILRVIMVLLLIFIVYSVSQLDIRTSTTIIIFFGLLINSPIYIRALLAVVALLICVRALDTLSGTRRDVLCIGTGLVCFIGQLITFEVGIFAFLSCIGLLFACVLWWLIARYFGGPLPHSPREIARATLFVSVTFIGMHMLIDTIFRITSPTYQPFDYIYYNLQIATSYNYIFGSTWGITTLDGMVLLTIALYCGATFLSRFADLSQNRRYLYIGLIILTIIHFKGAVVRSGEGKILMSLTPLFILFVLLIFDSLTQKRPSSLGVTLLFCMSIILPYNYGGKSLHWFAYALENPSFLKGYIQQVAYLHIPPSSVVPDDFAASLDPHTYILNFPYENLISIALDRKHVTPILQPYSAPNIVLQQRYVERLSMVKDRTEIVYSLDAITSGEIDIIQNITRSPLIFEYIFGNFELKFDRLFHEGYAILRPRSTPVTLPSKKIDYTLRQENGILRANFVSSQACTILRLNMTISYPPTAAFGRPTTVGIRALNGENELMSRRIPAISVGKPFSTYFYPGDVRDFYKVFSSEVGNSTTTIVDAIEISQVSMGLFDVQPDNIQLSGMDCIDLGPGDVVASQNDQDTVLAPIVNGDEVKQEFVSDRTGLAGIYISVATFGLNNSGPLTFKLEERNDANTAIVAESTIDMANLADNTFILFRFASQTSAGKQYTLYITAPEGTPTNTVTFWIKTGNPYPQGRLFYADHEIQGDLTFRLLYTRP